MGPVKRGPGLRQGAAECHAARCFSQRLKCSGGRSASATLRCTPGCLGSLAAHVAATHGLQEVHNFHSPSDLVSTCERPLSRHVPPQKQARPACTAAHLPTSPGSLSIGSASTFSSWWGSPFLRLPPPPPPPLLVLRERRLGGCSSSGCPPCASLQGRWQQQGFAGCAPSPPASFSPPPRRCRPRLTSLRLPGRPCHPSAAGSSA